MPLAPSPTNTLPISCSPTVIFVIFLFNKFLLERYLYKIMYNKIKITNKLDKMQRDRTHIFKVKNRYISEEIALNKRFSGKM